MKLKVTIATILALAMGVALVGCSGDAGADNAEELKKAKNEPSNNPENTTDGADPEMGGGKKPMSSGG